MPKANAKKKLPVGKGKIGFTVVSEYGASPTKLWEAITRAKHVQKFFVTEVTGDFTPQLTPVEWYWKEWGRHVQQPTAYVKEKKLEFVWPNHAGSYMTKVTFTLKRKGKLTELSIHERGWTQAHLKNAFMNCEGWTTYLHYLKAYVMHGIDLRTGK